LHVGVGLAGEVERLPAVHVRHHLGQVSHVDQRAADIAIAEVLDLRPLGPQQEADAEWPYASPTSARTGSSSWDTWRR
jgi:hypothetical protein